jgi:SH3 domain protein
VPGLLFSEIENTRHCERLTNHSRHDKSHSANHAARRSENRPKSPTTHLAGKRRVNSLHSSSVCLLSPCRVDCMAICPVTAALHHAIPIAYLSTATRPAGSYRTRLQGFVQSPCEDCLMSLSRHFPSCVTPVHNLAFAACLLASVSAQAEENANSTRWVSDSLNTYVRSGPTEGYRIVGTLVSGQKVTLLRTDGDYSQVRGESGNAVWIANRDLQEVPGQAERLPQLEQKVSELSAELDGINDTWKTRVQGMQETLDSRKTLIDELQTTRSTLDSELNQANSQLRELQAQLGEENQQVLMRYMAYGGGIAGAGLVAGLILPLLLRVRRKRNDQWV